MPTKVTLKFKKEKETPGAVRYMEVDEAGNQKDQNSGAIVPTIYIRKSGLPNGIPAEIKADFYF